MGLEAKDDDSVVLAANILVRKMKHDRGRYGFASLQVVAYVFQLHGGGGRWRFL